MVFYLVTDDVIKQSFTIYWLLSDISKHLFIMSVKLSTYWVRLAYLLDHLAYTVIRSFSWRS